MASNDDFYAGRLRLTAYLRAVENIPQRPSRLRQRLESATEDIPSGEQHVQTQDSSAEPRSPRKKPSSRVKKVSSPKKRQLPVHTLPLLRTTTLDAPTRLSSTTTNPIDETDPIEDSQTQPTSDTRSRDERHKKVALDPRKKKTVHPPESLVKKVLKKSFHSSPSLPVFTAMSPSAATTHFEADGFEGQELVIIPLVRLRKSVANARPTKKNPPHAVKVRTGQPFTLPLASGCILSSTTPTTNTSPPNRSLDVGNVNAAVRSSQTRSLPSQLELISSRDTARSSAEQDHSPVSGQLELGHNREPAERPLTQDGFDVRHNGSSTATARTAGTNDKLHEQLTLAHQLSSISAPERRASNGTASVSSVEEQENITETEDYDDAIIEGDRENARHYMILHEDDLAELLSNDAHHVSEPRDLASDWIMRSTHVETDYYDNGTLVDAAR